MSRLDSFLQQLDSRGPLQAQHPRRTLTRSPYTHSPRTQPQRPPASVSVAPPVAQRSGKALTARWSVGVAVAVMDEVGLWAVTHVLTQLLRGSLGRRRVRWTQQWQQLCDSLLWSWGQGREENGPRKVFLHKKRQARRLLQLSGKLSLLRHSTEAGTLHQLLSFGITVAYYGLGGLLLGHRGHRSLLAGLLGLAPPLSASTSTPTNTTTATTGSRLGATVLATLFGISRWAVALVLKGGCDLSWSVLEKVADFHHQVEGTSDGVDVQLTQPWEPVDGSWDVVSAGGIQQQCDLQHDRLYLLERDFALLEKSGKQRLDSMEAHPDTMSGLVDFLDVARRLIHCCQEPRTTMLEAMEKLQAGGALPAAVENAWFKAHLCIRRSCATLQSALRAVAAAFLHERDHCAGNVGLHPQEEAGEGSAHGAPGPLLKVLRSKERELYACEVEVLQHSRALSSSITAQSPGFWGRVRLLLMQQVRFLLGRTAEDSAVQQNSQDAPVHPLSPLTPLGSFVQLSSQISAHVFVSWLFSQLLLAVKARQP